MRNRVYLQAAENEVIVGLVSSRGDIVKAVSVKCVRLSGHASRFQNYFRISSISYQKNWIGVWILSISPPPLLFLFFI